jgi:predicted alpha/beta-hydrolase family hydrolase
MNQTYLLVKARNTVTGQTIKTQDLTGARFTLKQRKLAQDMADQTAVKMSARTGQLWEGYLVEYQPTERAS